MSENSTLEEAGANQNTGKPVIPFPCFPVKVSHAAPTLAEICSDVDQDQLFSEIYKGTSRQALSWFY